MMMMMMMIMTIRFVCGTMEKNAQFCIPHLLLQNDKTHQSFENDKCKCKCDQRLSRMVFFFIGELLQRSVAILTT